MGRHARLDRSGSPRPASSRVPGRSAEPQNPGSEPVGPVRTCVGCRQRDAQSQMIRFVMSRGDEDGASPGVVADPRRVRPGRGAWLHDDARCAERAIARKAFQRALRVPHGIAINGLTIPVDPMSSGSTTRRQGSGLEADGHPMSTQR